MKVSVVIPTVDGRTEYLARCVRGYTERTDADIELIVIEGKPTCGIAWQEGAEQATGDYLHLTADDIVPGEGWLPPFVEAVARGCVPCGLVALPEPGDLDDDHMPLAGNPIHQGHSHFFEYTGGLDVFDDWTEASGQSQYPSVPFCSMPQWRRIEPMVALHYGTDKWFGMQARRHGIANVVRHGSVFYHYAAIPGRAPANPDWTHRELITFDQVIAYPEYARGRRQPRDPDPRRLTDEGLRLTRAWMKENDVL